MSKRTLPPSDSRRKTLSVIMAAINGLNAAAPLALPAMLAPEKPQERRLDAGEAALTSFRHGTQLLDSLFFATAYAEDVTGPKEVDAFNSPVDGDRILAGGTQTVRDGGVATSTTITSDGLQNLYPNGHATSTTIEEGGYQYISGGTATSTTVSGAMANQGVYEGSLAEYTTLSAGGVQEVTGSATSGLATDTAIYSGGTQTVMYTGSATRTAIYDGGVQAVIIDASVDATTVYTGGTQALGDLYMGFPMPGGTATGTILSGGEQVVSSGGVAIDTVIFGGTQSVYSAGVASGTVVSGGKQVIHQDGHASFTTVGAGGSQRLVGGTAGHTTLSAGGVQEVDGIFDSGTLEAAGLATDTIIRGGTQFVGDAGSATGTVISAGGLQLAADNGSLTSTTIQSGGRQFVLSSGSADATTVYTGGTQFLGLDNLAGNLLGLPPMFMPGGNATATVLAGGEQVIYEGGVAAGTVISAGTQTVCESGTASGTSISGGMQLVLSGGTATGTAIFAGGSMAIDVGAQITGITALSGGTIYLGGSSGSYAISSLAAAGGTVQLANGSSTGRHLTINNLSGAANFRINTDLAHGTADTITVNSVTGVAANTVQVAYDPAYLTGANATGSATFATVSGGGATITGAAYEHGAYSYTPTITSTTSGTTTTWAVTALTRPTSSSSSGSSSSAGTGASETVKTAADATAGTLMTWRTENNNLTKRMGELRNATGQEGFWLRSFRGSERLTGTAGRTVSQQYTALQTGYDRKINRGSGVWYVGSTLGYLEGSGTFSRGTGDVSTFSLGAYGSWLGNKGHFLDIIAKAGKFRNSYTDYLNNSANTLVNSNYDNWGTSLSVEYGRRLPLKKGWYLEPQAELTFDRINSAAYTASDGTSVRNDTVTSLTGRIGLAVGRNDGVIHYYGKASVVREFSAEAVITAASGTNAPVTYRQDLKESWLEFTLGITAKISKKVDGYLEFTRTTGEKVKTPWQFNAGARWNF